MSLNLYRNVICILCTSNRTYLMGNCPGNIQCFLIGCNSDADVPCCLTAFGCQLFSIFFPPANRLCTFDGDVDIANVSFSFAQLQHVM